MFVVRVASHPGPYVVLRVQRRREPGDEVDVHRAGAARDPHQQREPDGRNDENGRQSVVRPGQVRPDFEPNTDWTIRGYSIYKYAFIASP